MEILDGKKLSTETKLNVKNKVEQYVSAGLPRPKLACILVGDDPASQTYVNSKEKTCAELGIDSVLEKLDGNSSTQEIIAVINRLNDDKSVNAILLQLPLPEALRPFEDEIINTISPQKDVDGLTTHNLGRLFADKSLVSPCTPSGIINLLKKYNVQIEGKRATVVGRSLLVGKSVAMLLLKEGATVQICTSKTKGLAQETKKADILVVCAGKEKLVTKDMVKDGAVVVDVGIHRKQSFEIDKNTFEVKPKTKLCGDVDFENVKDKTSFITPVPGGVGPMTIAELMQNTLILYKNQLALKIENACLESNVKTL